jgi:hypothetical protein
MAKIPEYSELTTPDDDDVLVIDHGGVTRKVKVSNLRGPAAAVSSVFGRTGAVVQATNDYTWAQINKASSSLADLATRSAADLSSGVLPDARFPATLPAVSGANLTNLNASNLASGTVPAARLDLTTYATKAYADSLVVGLLDDRGNFDASGNVFPSSGGSGSAGAIMKGDLWTISVAGTLGGHPVTAGDVVRALVDAPGQTDSNWAIGENNFGYVALNQALADGKIYVGNSSGIGTAVTPSGDVTFTNAGVTAIGALKVTNAMLAGSIAAAKLIGTDITVVGTIGTGAWQGTVIGSTYGGTGVNNAGRTITINTNSGTLAFSAASKTLTIAKSLTLEGTDGTTMTFPGTSASVARIDAAQTFTGNQSFANHILPTLPDTSDLGSATLPFRKGWLSELDAVLFAQNTISVIGGWLVVAKGEGTVDEDVDTSETQIDFGTNNISANDFIVFRANGAVEYMQATSLVSGNNWNVTRNADGSGANAWPQGSVWVNFGYTGSGRIELNANSTPRISMMTQGATYNAQTELLRMGDLNGGWGYSAETYGFAVGDSAAVNLTMDPSNGFRIRFGTTNKLVADVSGNLSIVGDMSIGTAGNLRSGATSFTAGAGYFFDYNGGTPRARIGSVGNVTLVPTDIAGCAAWLKAESLVASDGDAITTWTDLSGNSNSPTQATAGKKPLYKTNIVNGKPVLRFDGSDDYLTKAFTLNQGFTVIMVYKQVALGASGSHDIIFDGGSAAAALLGVNNAPHTNMYAGAVLQSGASPTFAPANGAFAVVTAVFNGGSSALYENGTQKFTGNAGSQNAGGFTLAALGDGSRTTQLDVAEVLIYSSALSASERQQVETYLADRYGLTISTTVYPQGLTKGFSWNGTSLSILDSALTMSGASAYFSIGATPPTSASVGTGIWIDRNAIVGLLANVVQAKFDAATGAIKAGAGNVTIDANGISLVQGVGSPNKLRWTGAGIAIAEVFTWSSTSAPTNIQTQFDLRNASDVKRAIVSFSAGNNSDTYTSRFQLIGDGASSNAYAVFYGAGTTGVTIGANQAPATSAILDLVSTTGALLPPRMTTTQRDALTATDGMILYNTTTGALNYRKAGAWVAI